ncbi:hypothetical protein PRZ48_008911 [Zasmidium cellare]|uniref:Uncharacterized protein n=1 Tax=Zasmidium cellare TaxID=395010 RepID=A0ABR0EHK4_ZASCE|nr:hypothetical protein PRZ48_008911 [Zasmidium cellare]
MAYHYCETTNFWIPHFSKLEFDSAPSAKSTDEPDEDLDALTTLLWLHADVFFNFSHNAYFAYGGLPSETSPAHLLRTFYHHEKFVRAARKAIPPGALARLSPENDDVKEAMAMLKRGNEYVAKIQDMRFVQEMELKWKQEAIEEHRQTQLALIKEYCNIQREMYEWEADIYFQAFCDFFQYPHEYKRTLARMQKDFFHCDRWFKGARGHGRLAEIKASVEPQYHILLWIGHPFMKKAAEKKEEADTGLDIVHDMLFELREWKEEWDESARVANHKFYENIAQMRKRVMLKQAEAKRPRC